jgi:lipid A 3-O-deacylase
MRRSRRKPPPNPCPPPEAAMLAALALALASSCVAPRADYFSVQSGSGDRVDVSGVGWELPVSECNGSGRLRAGLLFRLDGWHGTALGGRDLMAASTTPFLRYELGRAFTVPFYAESGIGMSLLSQTRVDEVRQFSTAFQFNEFVGIGARLDRKGEQQLSLRLQHVSNGGIKRPNDGLTYAMLSFNYRF